jgi:plasmid stability protein
MKEQAGPVQYTIRGIPPEVDRALRAKAARRKKSLNQVIVDELIVATLGGAQREDFSDLVGAWTPDPAFDEILASQRQIDPEQWK